MLAALRGKKTYILMGLAIAATLFLVWQGTMTAEQAVPTITVALGFIGFRDAVAQALAKLLAELARESGQSRGLGTAARGQPENRPEEGSVRRL